MLVEVPQFNCKQCTECLKYISFGKFHNCPNIPLSTSAHSIPPILIKCENCKQEYSDWGYAEHYDKCCGIESLFELKKTDKRLDHLKINNKILKDISKDLKEIKEILKWALGSKPEDG